MNEVCVKYTNTQLDEYITQNFNDINLENFPVNQAQRILLVGTSVDEPLQRMIEWLSNNYEVSVNYVILKYIRTESGDELLARTVIIPEEIAEERSQKQQRIIQMSDEPGNYEKDELMRHLKDYLSLTSRVPSLIRKILLPLCLDHEPVRREEIKELVKENYAEDAGRSGTLVSNISTTLGYKHNDFLRQVISYEKTYPGIRDNYRIKQEYKKMVQDLLTQLKKESKPENII